MGLLFGIRIRGTLCVCILYVICCNTVSSDDCSKMRITMQDGYGRVYPRQSRGCTNRCSLNTTQVYVLVQMGTSSTDKSVSVTLQSACGDNLPIGLVLISDEPITWRLNYGLPIHLMTGYVLYPSQGGSSPSSDVYRMKTALVFNSSKIQIALNNIWNTGDVSSLIDKLQEKGINNIRSINMAQNVNSWYLPVGKDCCYPDTVIKDACYKQDLMGNGGLAKYSDTNTFSRGCMTECPSVMPYVHVISQSIHGATQKVSVWNSCIGHTDVVLILMSRTAVSWTILHDRQTNIKMVHVIQTRKGNIETKSRVFGIHSDLISYQTQTLLDMIYQENWSKHAVQMLHLHLQVQYNLSPISSISVLSYSYPVELMIEEQCCYEMRTLTQSSTSSPSQPDTIEPAPTMNPMTTSKTSPTVLGPGGEDSKGTNASNKTALVAGLVTLFIVIISASIGIACYFYWKTQKRSSGPIASQPANPNIYVQSPTETQPESAGIMGTSPLPS